MRVYDVAAFPLEHGRFRKNHRRRNRQSTKQRVMEMLEVVGLDHAATRWSTQLSGGQQQRLALARALLCDPDLLLLDEPLSNLDAKLRSQLRTELKSFQRDFGVTTLYVTHDQSEALALSDGIAVLQGGLVEQLGTPKEIYESPSSSFVASFVGSANLIPASGHAASAPSAHVDVSTNVGMIRCRWGQDEPEADSATSPERNVCIRPEDVDVAPESAERLELNQFEGIADSTEFLGHLQLMVVDLAGVKVNAYLAPFSPVRPGDKVRVSFRPDRALYLLR
jgi:iron(III) transport system ATP-binding protein